MRLGGGSRSEEGLSSRNSKREGGSFKRGERRERRGQKGGSFKRGERRGERRGGLFREREEKGERRGGSFERGERKERRGPFQDRPLLPPPLLSSQARWGGPSQWRSERGRIARLARAAGDGLHGRIYGRRDWICALGVYDRVHGSEIHSRIHGALDRLAIIVPVVPTVPIPYQRLWPSELAPETATLCPYLRWSLLPVSRHVTR